MVKTLGSFQSQYVLGPARHHLNMMCSTLRSRRKLSYVGGLIDWIKHWQVLFHYMVFILLLHHMVVI